MKVVVFGATGHTGKLTMEALRARGVEAVGFGSKQVNVRDIADVREALRGADGVANLAGPFLRTGLAPARAAVERGIPYVDTTGEQAFMLETRQELGAAARQAGVALVNAMAYEYALSDLVARERMPEGGASLHVLYRNRGTAPSAGTKKSILRVLAGPAMGWEDGRLARVGQAASRHTFATADGPRTGVSFPGGEILTIPRHTPFRTVRTYAPVKSPAQARAAAVLARALLHGPAMTLAERVVDRRHRTPRNEKARGEIYLASGARQIRIDTPDPYAATAEICAEGITRLVEKPRGAGVLAPAEAFDPRDTLRALGSRIDSLAVVETSK